MLAGASDRGVDSSRKLNPFDFVLWKGVSDNSTSWESPFGAGRPGWHIECSAMSTHCLGSSFDIHGGGHDLQFPHHENEIAQSKCAHPEGEFARYWMHNEMLQVEGKKMSKSLGNFFTVRDLLDQGVPGEVIRFVFLQTHYRKPMDWTEKKRQEAERTLAQWFKITENVDSDTAPSAAFLAALADDLNTHQAIAEMHRMEPSMLKAAMKLIGLPAAEDVDWFRTDDKIIVGTSSTGDTPLYYSCLLYTSPSPRD